MSNVTASPPISRIAPLRSRVVRFRASDGAMLTGDLFEANADPVGAVLLASAMAVPRRYYAPFAQFLAGCGLTTLTFDYRGIGDSRVLPTRDDPATLSEWAERDLPAAAKILRQQSGFRDLGYVGHSVGGQLLGLAGEVAPKAAVMIGAQSGYWGHWPGVEKIGMAALWHAIIPAFVATRKQFAFGFGASAEPIPGGVASQWASWARDPRYILSYLEKRDGERAFSLEAKIRFYAFTDDAIAPVAAVQALYEMYPRAKSLLAVAKPEEYGVRHIGHFGAFREKIGRRKLWPEIATWMTAALGVD
jgi:predicted alpha/beta hydrolase